MYIFRRYVLNVKRESLVFTGVRGVLTAAHTQRLHFDEVFEGRLQDLLILEVVISMSSSFLSGAPVARWEIDSRVPVLRAAGERFACRPGC